MLIIRFEIEQSLSKCGIAVEKKLRRDKNISLESLTSHLNKRQPLGYCHNQQKTCTLYTQTKIQSMYNNNTYEQKLQAELLWLVIHSYSLHIGCIKWSMHDTRFDDERSNNSPSVSQYVSMDQQPPDKDDPE